MQFTTETREETVGIVTLTEKSMRLLESAINKVMYEDYHNDKQILQADEAHLLSKLLCSLEGA